MTEEQRAALDAFRTACVAYRAASMGTGSMYERGLVLLAAHTAALEAGVDERRLEDVLYAVERLGFVLPSSGWVLR